VRVSKWVQVIICLLICLVGALIWWVVQATLRVAPQECMKQAGTVFLGLGGLGVGILTVVNHGGPAAGN
jgi:hypothetical protein